MKNYININKQSWNNRVDAHLQSAFYDLPGFIAGATSLKDIDLELLGDLTGKTVLHMQCHFGMDTISMSRLGAKTTGVDLSDKAIEAARDLANKVVADAEFICCNVYDLPQHCDKQFDIVYTSYGTIGWLPDLQSWASVIAKMLKPGGKLIFVEFHPVVWMFDDDFTKVGYNYFNSGPIDEIESGTYADRDAPIQQEYIMWNHGMGEVLESLINNGLQLNTFKEFDYSPFNCFKHTIELEPGKFRIQHLEHPIPMVYALSATKTI